MDETLQALLDLSMMTLETLHNKISVVNMSKRRKRQLSSNPPSNLWSAKLWEHPCTKKIRSSVFENKKQKRASIQLSIVGYYPIS